MALPIRHNLTLLLIALYFVLTGLLQYMVSGVAELDQSEQLITSQEIRLGYGHQPPLYQWITFLLSQLIGNNLFTVTLVKVSILSLMCLGLHQTCRYLRISKQNSTLILLSIFLVPQLVWESQRDLTHSVLATALAAWFIAAALRVREKGTTRDYLSLGIVAGFGIISKYNFAILPAALFCTAILCREERHLLFTTKALAAIAAAVAIIAPHLVWAVEHVNTASAGFEKLGRNGDQISAVLQLTKALLLYLTPLWLVYLLVLPGTQAFKDISQNKALLFIIKWTISITLLLLILVLALGAETFKDRWLMPLLTPLLVTLGSIASKQRNLAFKATAIFVAILCSFFIITRPILVASGYLPPDRASTPFASHPGVLNVQTQPKYIFSDDRYIGGNMKVLFKDALVYVPTFYSLRSENIAQASNGENILIVCKSDPCGVGLTELIKASSIVLSELELTESVAYFDYARSKPHKLYFGWIK